MNEASGARKLKCLSLCHALFLSCSCFEIPTASTSSLVQSCASSQELADRKYVRELGSGGGAYNTRLHV